jgi:hypothetical protein
MRRRPGYNWAAAGGSGEQIITGRRRAAIENARACRRAGRPAGRWRAGHTMCLPWMHVVSSSALCETHRSSRSTRVLPGPVQRCHLESLAAPIVHQCMHGRRLRRCWWLRLIQTNCCLLGLLSGAEWVCGLAMEWFCRWRLRVRACMVPVWTPNHVWSIDLMTQTPWVLFFLQKRYLKKITLFTTPKG